MHLKEKIFISTIFLMLIALSVTSIPLANINDQPISEAPITSLATYNILWNETSDFNNYISNNCTIESDNLSLKEIGITYDFTVEEPKSDPDGWWIFEGSDRSINVTSGLGDHDKVVEIFDNSTIGSPWMIDYFDSQTYGMLEFWLQTKSGWSDKIWVYLGVTPDYPESQGLGVGVFKIDIRDTGEVYIWGSASGEFMNNWTDDVWHHFRIEFNCTSKKADVWFDGGYEGDYDFAVTDYSYVHQLVFLPRYGAGTYLGTFYVDAIDYSWMDSGYFINRSYLYYGQTYYDTCVWESTTQNLGDNNPYYENITFSSQTDSNTAVYISYRDSQDSVDWSDWTVWSSSNIILTKNGHHYFQVRALLNTSNALHTPVLEWVNFCYTIVK